MITADVGEPGTPSVIIGTRDATPAASAVACGPMMPLTSPLPNSALFFEYCRARPYPRKDAAVAPWPGSTPKRKPITAFEHTSHSRCRSAPSASKRSLNPSRALIFST